MDIDSVDLYALIGADQDISGTVDHLGADEIAALGIDLDGYIGSLQLKLTAVQQVLGMHLYAPSAGE